MPKAILAPYQAVAGLVGAGGPAVLCIFLAGVLMWMLIFERFWFFRWRLPQLVEQSLQSWYARGEHQSWAAHQIRKALISRLNAEMSASLPMLKVLVPLCPLIGLVGTVTGMLEVFDSMALLGSADARTMASGVSKAMNCTMTGLAVSVSGMYPVFQFQATVRRQTELLADSFKF
jgi:biopolymer transport protein ExbB